MLHRLFLLWAPPRSLSTAFVRVITERGDFTVLHEPLCDLAAGVPHPLSDGSGRSLPDPEALFAHVEMLRTKGHVFVKDTCEYDYCDVLRGTGYLRDAQHVFMLRNPAKVINSHYHINPKLSCADVGYAHLVGVYDLVVDQAKLRPIFVDADQLIADPERTVKEFCSSADLVYMPSALEWKSGDLPIWQRTKHWHVDAAHSTRIEAKTKQYEHRVDNTPLLQSYYDANLPHYEYLQRARRASALQRPSVM